MKDRFVLFLGLGIVTTMSVGALINPPTPLVAESTVTLSGSGITFPDGSEQTTAAARDLTTFVLLTDQTVSSSRLLGLGLQSNAFDDVALLVPEDGWFTQLSLSIRQNIGPGAAPIGPGPGESVSAYLVIVPFDDIDLDYGAPQVSVAGLENFLDGGAIDDGTYVPVGTRVELMTVLDQTTGHLARTSIGDLASAPAVTAGDLFTVWLRPSGFSSFQPVASLTLATSR
jgi:hypothetical protein